MDKKTGGILHIVSALAIMAAVIYFFYFSTGTSILKSYGYVGAFLIALLTSATIIVPVPGWIAIALMSRDLDPVLLGSVAGVGAAIGELTGYVAGEGTRELLNSRIKESKRIEKTVKEYGMLGIFVLAFIPNPLFDIAGVVARGLKMPWWKFLIACAAGRVLRYILLAMVGAFTLELIG